MVGLRSAMDKTLRLLASFAAPCRERAVEHAGPVQHHDCHLLFLLIVPDPELSFTHTKRVAFVVVAFSKRAGYTHTHTILYEYRLSPRSYSTCTELRYRYMTERVIVITAVA